MGNGVPGDLVIADKESIVKTFLGDRDKLVLNFDNCVIEVTFGSIYVRTDSNLYWLEDDIGFKVIRVRKGSDILWCISPPTNSLGEIPLKIELKDYVDDVIEVIRRIVEQKS